MKSMIYLSGEAEQDRFEALANELDIAVSHYNIGQVKSLVAFVTREKTIRDQSYLVIDLTGTDFSDEHILSAIQSLRCFSAARPVFLAPASPATEELFGKLLNYRVYNVISMSEKTDIIAEMRKCLSDEGMSLLQQAPGLQDGRAAAANTAVCPLKIPKALSITVHVCGCMPRIGTTTQAFALWHYLKSLGFAPAVLAENREFEVLLKDLYEMEITQEDGWWSLKGIPFCREHDPARWNAYIVDGGVLDQTNRDRFVNADLSVLIGGTKPWELARFGQSMSLAAGVKRLVTLLSFATAKDAEELAETLHMRLRPVPYHPDIWEQGGAWGTYRDVVLPHLKELCGP